MANLNIKINFAGVISIAFTILFGALGLWWRLESGLSNINENMIRVQENTKETNNIRNEITKIEEHTKEINSIKIEVHDLLYNQRERQAKAALRKTTNTPSYNAVQSGMTPESASIFNPGVLANLSIENKISQTEFSRAVEILASKPYIEAKLELKNQNLFTDAQIEKIFMATEEPLTTTSRGRR